MAEQATGIPRQVMEAADMATDLHEKMFGKKTPEQPGEQPPTPSGEEPGKPPAEAPKEAEKPKEGDTPPAQPQAKKEGETPPEPDDPEARYQALLKEHETLTQQHKTLKGKYDKEVPHNASRADRLANELAEFKGQVMERLGRMAEGQPAAKASDEDKDLLEKAERLQSQYGDEYTDMLRAFMLREIKPLLRDTVKPVEDSVHTVQDAQALVNEQSFIKAVNENLEVDAPWVDDWREEGSNPDFEAFLDQPDPSGIYTNRQLADIFNENHDGVRFAKLLSQFYKQSEATPPQGQEPQKEAAAAPEPPKAPEKPKKEPAKEQHHMTAPDATPPAAVPETTEGKIIWTQETMDAFYAKDRKNGYSPEESQRLWNDLLLAPAEGRIQPRQISQ